jgi:hypothetical protein
MHGGDNRLFRLLDDVDDIGQRRRGHGFGRAEFGDVGTGREHAAGAGQNDASDFAIVACRLKRLRQGGSERQSEAVYRRMIQAQHGCIRN